MRKERSNCMLREEKSLLSWSGGKDSALALFRFKNDENCRIVAILTSLTEDYNRISMHGCGLPHYEHLHKMVTPVG